MLMVLLSSTDNTCIGCRELGQPFTKPMFLEAKVFASSYKFHHLIVFSGYSYCIMTLSFVLLVVSSCMRVLIILGLLQERCGDWWLSICRF